MRSIYCSLATSARGANTMTTQQNLLRLMRLPIGDFAAVVRTADGYYVGMRHGDCGYNVFLGTPEPVHAGDGLNWTRQVWSEMTSDERRAVRAWAREPLDGSSIDLADFGVPSVEVRPEE